MVTTPFLEIEKASMKVLAGSYINESITYNMKTTSQKDTIIWKFYFLKLVEEEKKTSSFICVAYQPSSNEIEKLEWLENFENLLVDVYLKWKSVFIVTVNFNIDLPGDLKESILRYKNLLHTFSLHQHITKATWKNKILIDHISSNINNKLSLIDVLMTNEMSGQDTPYRTFNIKKECCEPRYKDVKNDLKMNDYVAVADQHSIWVRWR